MQAEDQFLSAAQALVQDAMYSVPSDVRELLAGKSGVPKIAILGTHGCGSYLLDISPDERGFDVVAVVDDPLSKLESCYHGMPLVSSEQFLRLAREHDGDLIAVNTCGKDGARRYFDQLCDANGVPHLNYEQLVRALGLNSKLDCRVVDWGPDIAGNVARYQALAQRFADADSVKTLYAVLNHHLACDTAPLQAVQLPYSSLYFQSGLLQFGQQEKMVDCGASVGESLQGLIKATGGEFARSWMIEPDRNNIRTLQTIIDGYKGTALEGRITLHPYGVGEKPGTVRFNHEGGHGGAVLDGGGDVIEIRPIDDIVDDAPTFIKMDVEGSELAALKGAASVIRDHAPKLTVSAYHRSTDLLDLSEYVLSLNPDYRVGIRHHTPLRWDTCLYFY